MTARDDILDRLLAERYDNRWWVTPQIDEAAQAADDELSAARRRRRMAEDYDRLNAAERLERPGGDA